MQTTRCCIAYTPCDNTPEPGFDSQIAQTFGSNTPTMRVREKVALLYLVGCAGYSLEEAQEKSKHLVVYESCLYQAAKTIFDTCHLSNIPEGLHDYIDYEKYAHELRCRGELVELMLGRQAYTINAGAV